VSVPLPVPDRLSYVALPTAARFESKAISTATAFCYLHDGKTYLVTNWHVVTGRDPQTLKPLDKINAALPDHLGVTFASVKNIDEKTNHIFWNEISIALYQDTERKKPTWLEHPNLGHRVDAVAIPLAGLGEMFKIAHANDATHELVRLRLYPSLDVYVLGFPLGITGGGQFPMWKRGTIASEPGVESDGLPKIYIDTATRKGMSGAPVYAQEVGLIVPEEPNDSAKGSIGKARRFLGVYASRLDGDEFSAQIGVVWKETAIIDIVAGNKCGVSSFELSAK
jgi:hypothetical protein